MSFVDTTMLRVPGIEHLLSSVSWFMWMQQNGTIATSLQGLFVYAHAFWC
jgi:hypothetical protein